MNQLKITKKIRIIAVLLGLLAALVVLFAVNVCMGSVKISFDLLLKSLFKYQSVKNMAEYSIIWKIRLPRVVAGVILGGALAISGYLLQTFFRNPIAGPYILGISSGAKLSVALVMTFSVSQAFSLTSGILIVAAFIGAMIALGFVLLISVKVKNTSMLIVGGVMVGYICSAITDFVITFADDTNIVNLHNWSLGSFSGMSWEQVRVMAVVVSVCMVFVYSCAKPLGAYLLGEVYAANLGVNIRLFRMVLIFFSSLLAACVTAFAGPVSFIGMAVPFLVKALLGSSKPLFVIPACFLGGSIFCIGCDLIARTIVAPMELNISSVTAVFGAPVVLFMMIRKRR